MKKICLIFSLSILTFACVGCAKNIDIHYDELPTNESVDYSPKSDIDELPVPNEVKPTDEVIHDIIIDKNMNMYTGGEVQACGFLILNEEEVDPFTKRVTGFVSYGEYNYDEENDKLEKIAGSGEIPTAITYNVNDPMNTYVVDEILTEDNLENEVHEMFAEKDWKKVLKRDMSEMEKIRKMEEKEAKEKLDIE